MTPKSSDLYMLARGSLEVKGQWELARTADGKLTALMSCPDCGRLLSLSGHSIDAKGFVSPSVVCDRPNGGCGFHKFIKLQGWQP
jgi:hypothetical protein